VLGGGGDSVDEFVFFMNSLRRVQDWLSLRRRGQRRLLSTLGRDRSSVRIPFNEYAHFSVRGNSPTRARFLNLTKWHPAVGRTPLDKWSAHRRHLYLTTHNTHKTRPCPRRDSTPESQQVTVVPRLRPLGHSNRQFCVHVYEHVWRRASSLGIVIRLWAGMRGRGSIPGIGKGLFLFCKDVQLHPAF
jgi:hypothetical protein